MPLTLATGATKALLTVTLLSVLAALGSGLYGWYRTNQAELTVKRLQLQIQQLSTNRDSWRASAERWKTDAARMAEEQMAAKAAVDALEQDQAANDARYEPAQQLIDRAEPTDDGPVAPVLRNVIEALP
ncbi:MAG: hypothetical protein R3175_07425 [Marinobacter sp.]|uniref:hypothetical protein n=1 Tax=Marinobacter sp. TaxID=50741 RepID=UPI00299F14E1|nr:hypothetical protein [Marinobacter sp.]MDX1755870.1 hypothetical protein [Marinobacter sp.]